jgi:predicted DNA-binding transcriptional regulator YafY
VEERREVEPWGVVSWHGRWYLVGHDRGRGATRVFRLSRITGEVSPVGPAGAVRVPSDVDLVGQVAEADVDALDRVARVRVRRGAAAGLRRWAQRDSTDPHGSVDSANSTEDDGYDRLELAYHDGQTLAERVAGYGADVIVDSPAELREAVIARLRALAEVAA